MKITKKTTKLVTYRIEGSDIVELLDLPEEANDVQVTIRIPSGGDYSGMSIDVDQDAPIFVTFSLESEG